MEYFSFTSAPLRRSFGQTLVLLAGLLAAAPLAAQAQTTPAGGVGIGTTGAPHPSALLEVSSTSKGLLPPRMTQAQRDAIAGPATGLSIYNTTTNKLNTWNGTSWDAALSVTEQPQNNNPAVTFAYTGAVQTYTVPAGVFSLSVDAQGASGGSGRTQSGSSVGGEGARVQATLSVVPGQVLQVRVGGAGVFSGSGASVGGYNGGGAVPIGGSGGGATDLRSSGGALADRLLVAAGGGGGYLGIYSQGGAGGTPTGGNGIGYDNSSPGPFLTATGGSQTAGGNTGGALGTGGSSTTSGGGGGGYYGGGGASDYGGGGGGLVVGHAHRQHRRGVHGRRLRRQQPHPHARPQLRGADPERGQLCERARHVASERGRRVPGQRESRHRHGHPQPAP